MYLQLEQAKQHNVSRKDTDEKYIANSFCVVFSISVFNSHVFHKQVIL